MSKLIVELNRMHRFFENQLLYPLLLSSALCVSLYIGRVYLSHHSRFFFLTWNLFLAWIPYLCSLWISSVHQRSPQRWWYLIVPGILWLIFLPNAPYLVTDLWHLDERPPVPFWYDIGLFATFAWTGCILTVASLGTMQSLVDKFFGRFVSWLFVFGAIGLSGLGIYLGRFLSWNSWDLILRPQSVIHDVATRLAHPFQYPQAFGVTILFSAFLLVCYFTFASIERRGLAAERSNG